MFFVFVLSLTVSWSRRRRRRRRRRHHSSSLFCTCVYRDAFINCHSMASKSKTVCIIIVFFINGREEWLLNTR